MCVTYDSDISMMHVCLLIVKALCTNVTIQHQF